MVVKLLYTVPECGWYVVLALVSMVVETILPTANVGLPPRTRRQVRRDNNDVVNSFVFATNIADGMPDPLPCVYSCTAPTPTLFTTTDRKSCPACAQ